MKRHAWRLGLIVGCSVALLALTASAVMGAEQGDSLPTTNQVGSSTGDPSQPNLRSDIDGEIPGIVQLGTIGSQSIPDETKESPPEDPVGGTQTGILEHLSAALILDYATFLVAVVTAIFAISLAGLGFFEWARFREFRIEVAKEREELAEASRTLEARVETFKSDLKAQEDRLASNQRFLEAVLSHHSNLLVGIVEGFGDALKPAETRRIGSLIFEANAALDLFYPDEAEVLKALLQLEQIGSHGSVSSLVHLRDDKDADPEIRIRAQQVLTKVLERLKKERRKPPPPPPASEGGPPPDEPPPSDAPKDGGPGVPPETGT